MSGAEFDGLLAMADLTVDRVMGEPFDIIPMRIVRNGKPARDFTRRVAEDVVGLWDNNATKISAGGAGGAQAHVASTPQAVFRPDVLPYGIATYDRVIRRKDGQLYQALAPRPDEQGRIVVPLQVIAPASPSPGL